MKTKILLLFFFLSIIPFASKAQHGEEGGMWERFKAQKISFITSNLNLTPEEAQKFWPLYNEFEKKRIDLQLQKRELDHKFKKESSTLSENEVEKMLSSLNDIFFDEAKLLKEYNKKFMQIIPPKKVFLLYQVENQFRANMIRQFKPPHPGGGSH
ncbi:MAG: hypothetical protein Q8862_06975 [Bacteroidota bacterium]|nr:hypothetical protein [Bacteroidota bacterium]MDP4206676.1 hypothetical protein [Bacteroidota bacterium]